MKEKPLKGNVEFSGVGVHTGREPKVELDTSETNGKIFLICVNKRN